MVTDKTGAYKIVGTRPNRPDATEKVLGQANYGADLSLPGMLYGQDANAFQGKCHGSVW